MVVLRWIMIVDMASLLYQSIANFKEFNKKIMILNIVLSLLTASCIALALYTSINLSIPFALLAIGHGFVGYYYHNMIKIQPGDKNMWRIKYIGIYPICIYLIVETILACL